MPYVRAMKVLLALGSGAAGAVGPPESGEGAMSTRSAPEVTAYEYDYPASTYSNGSAYEPPWEYDTRYLFPLTRQLGDSGIGRTGQGFLYPIAFAIDLIQWPLGAVAGLFGS